MQFPDFAPTSQGSWADEVEQEDYRSLQATTSAAWTNSSDDPGTDEVQSSDAAYSGKDDRAKADRQQNRRRRGVAATASRVQPMMMPQPRQRGRGGNTSGSDSAASRSVVVPWLTRGARNLTLAEEMEGFAAYVTLTPAEHTIREQCVEKLRSAAEIAWASSSTVAYGSFALGLSFSTSDLDVAVDCCGNLQDGVDIFMGCATSEGFDIIGMVCNETDAFIKVRGSAGVTCNISVNEGRSPVREGLAILKSQLDLYPQVRACVLTLRTVLSQCQLTDVTTGGVSSYCILLLALRLAQWYEPSHCPDPGALLRIFLSHYGQDFDFAAHTVQLTYPGCMPAEGRLHPTSPVSVSDPLDPQNNVAQGCTKMGQVKAMMKYCDLALARWDTPEIQEESFRGHTPLCTIIAAKALAGRPGRRTR
eukprot:TRINITY_DN35438_c0_g1_i1.p1 TRINITY_DN35438_c0_g1~~TRINITY_DN35438_c0_g1_i1.p1  ORF type:complete len:419 (+),score=134.63 TRINITY_DN35438_c0_g1_i1:75-1331(+)